MNSIIHSSIEHHLRLVKDMQGVLPERISAIASILVDAIGNGNKILWCGNGGSAADSQHLAAELIGRFKRERQPISSIALTTDTSILTCVGNDYGFEDIFARQVMALANQNDVLICISTSGDSSNIKAAAKAANDKNVLTIGLLGNDGGSLASICNESIVIPDSDTARVQEMHILVGHILCDLVERSVAISQG